MEQREKWEDEDEGKTEANIKGSRISWKKEEKSGVNRRRKTDKN